MKSLFTLLTLLAITFNLYSQAILDSVATHELEEVIVKEYGFALHNNPNATVTKLTAEKLELTRPEKITDGLLFLPGIYSVPDGIGGQTLNIRGYEQNRVNIYFNGIPLRSNTEGRINNDGLFFTNSDISFEKGIASLIYSSNSSGNVIRIDNKVFTEEKFNLKLNSYFGNNGKQSYNAMVSGNIKHKLYYQLSGNYYNRNSFRLSNDFDTIPSQPSYNRNNSDQNNIETLATFTYVPSDKHLISLTFMHNISTFGYPPSTSNPRFRRMDFWHNTILGLRHNYTVSKKANIETSFYQTHLIDTLNEYHNNTYTTIRRFSFWNDISLGARSILSYELVPNHKLNVAIDYRNDSHDQVWFTKATTKANTFLSTLEYQVELLTRILINSGISYNFSNPSYTSTNESVVRKNLSAWNYQLSASYTPIEAKYKVNVGFNKSTIFPRMRDLYGDVLIGYTPNPDLTFESSYTFEAGFNAYPSSKVNLSFTSYYSIIDNLITQIKDSDTTNQIINLQSSEFIGGELFFNFPINDKVFTLLSYSYLNAKNTSDGRTSDYIANRPKHQFKTFISYIPSKYIGIDLTYTLIANRYYDNQGVWMSLPNYSIIDFGVSSKAIKRFTIWVKVLNLLDKYNLNSFDQPSFGREFRVGVSFDYSLSDK